jgi:predicted hydrocarbon binding protein
MAAERVDRSLPADFMRCFLGAIAIDMGNYSLQLMLHQAGLQRFSTTATLPEDVSGTRASEFAALQNSIRAYYGQGARGSLNRIGRTAWRELVGAAGFGRKARHAVARLLPLSLRAHLVLDDLAARMRGADGNVSVHLLDVDLYFFDHTSDATFGQTASEPICWATLGMVQGAVQWATGVEYDVEEITCRAMGADACQFRIRK